MAEKKKVKKNKKEKSKKKPLEILLLIFVILLLLFIASETFGVVTVSSVADSIKTFFVSLEKGDGYPYSISSNSVKDIEMLNSNLFLLTDSDTICLDSTAKEISDIQHSFTKPAMAVSDSRAIVYDRGAKSYKVMNRTKVFYEGKTDNEIFTASIGKKGNVAFGTLSDDAQSTLTVLNSSCEKTVFEWNCTSYSIITIGLSDNGKKAAVGVIGSKDGDIYSKVYVFDFDYSEPLATYDYEGSAVVNVSFTDSSDIVVICDNMISMINDIGEKSNDIKFTAGSLSYFDIGTDGLTAVAVSQYGSSNINTLTVYNKKTEKLFDKDYDKAIKSIYCSDGKVTVLTETGADVYNSKGEKTASYKCASDTIKAMTYGKFTYIFSVGDIKRYS